ELGFGDGPARPLRALARPASIAKDRRIRGGETSPLRGSLQTRNPLERSQAPRERAERDGVPPQAVRDPRFLQEQASLGDGVVWKQSPRRPVRGLRVGEVAQPLGDLPERLLDNGELLPRHPVQSAARIERLAIEASRLRVRVLSAGSVAGQARESPGLVISTGLEEV